MAAVLGISAYYHDAAAALVVDGRIVAAMQEERFSRLKNDPSLPRRAAFACLALGGLQPGELDAVVFYENPYAKLERVVVSLARDYPRTLRQFAPALGGQLGSKLWVLDQLADTLGVERRKVRFVEHHESHAASAFLTSAVRRRRGADRRRRGRAGDDRALARRGIVAALPGRHRLSRIRWGCSTPPSPPTWASR